MDVLHATVCFHERTTCFAYLTPSAQILQQIAGFESLGNYKVINSDSEATAAILHVLRKKYSSPSVFSLHINTELAKLRNIHENDLVILERLPYAVSCISCKIMPATEADWLYVRDNAEEIEMGMLGQLRLVELGSTYPFWDSCNRVHYFTIVSAVPSSEIYVNLTVDTEMHVIPINDQNIALGDEAPSTSSQKSLTAPSGTEMSFSSILNRLHIRGRNLRTLPKAIVMDIESLTYVSAIYIYKKDLSNSVPNVSVVRVSKSGEIRHALLFELSSACATHREILQFLKRYQFYNCLCSLTLTEEWGEMEWIDLQSTQQTDVVLIRRLQVTVEDGREIDRQQFQLALQKKLWMVCQQYPIIVPRKGLRIKLELSDEGLVTCVLRSFGADEGLQTKCLLFTNEQFPELQFAGNDPSLSMAVQPELVGEREAQIVNDDDCDDRGILELGFQKALLSDCMNYLDFSVSRGSGQLLILGPKMSGKTTLLGKIADALLHSRWVVFSEVLKCEQWKGKSADGIAKILVSTVKSLVSHRPSALILDNIDTFSQKIAQDDSLLVEKVITKLERLVERNRIILITSAQNKRDALHFISKSDERQFYGHVVCIGDLSKEDRAEYFRNTFAEEISETNLNDLALKTMNFTVGDLKKLALRLKLEACAGQCGITSEVIQQALSQFCSGGVFVQKWNENQLGAKISWDDVGGMESIKQLLMEMIIWPTKYPVLFASCEIRLGHGVLLHGPSGCGKTLIAKALAAECGYSVIFVKGPELLSKYVGQSEENVRNTFDRARASKPCLIVFDEFDALGSKRGKQDTGVTDRVVNQLLTELDGMKELNDVYVIATTNRLDMIDLALLRPGRFDKIVECGLPDCDERECILNILCRELCLINDVDMKTIATKTDGWTGVDLKGLVTDAQFYAQKKLLTNVNGERAQIGQNDFLKALKDYRTTKVVSNVPRINAPAGMFFTLA